MERNPNLPDSEDTSTYNTERIIDSMAEFKNVYGKM